jgi:hypothetical protein
MIEIVLQSLHRASQTMPFCSQLRFFTDSFTGSADAPPAQ